MLIVFIPTAKKSRMWEFFWPVEKGINWLIVAAQFLDHVGLVKEKVSSNLTIYQKMLKAACQQPFLFVCSCAC